MTERRDLAEAKLDEVIALLQRLVALELSRRGATHEAIGKNLRVAKAAVGEMLAGVKKEDSNDR